MSFERILPGNAGAAMMVHGKILAATLVAPLVMAMAGLDSYSVAATAEAARSLSCTGKMIEPTAVEQSPKTVQFSLGPKGKVAVDLGQGNVDAKLVSDNKVQLKFSTKDFTGEYFHYTGDLFLIYKSGHLARLACKTGD
jgi:hypothetical protein